MAVAQKSHFGLADSHHGFAIEQYDEVVAGAMPFGERPVPHAAQSSMAYSSPRLARLSRLERPVSVRSGERVGRVDKLWFVPAQPANSRIFPEPDVLSAGKPPGRKDRLLLRLGLADGVGQEIEYLPVPEGA